MEAKNKTTVPVVKTEPPSPQATPKPKTQPVASNAAAVKTEPPSPQSTQPKNTKAVPNAAQKQANAAPNAAQKQANAAPNAAQKQANAAPNAAQKQANSAKPTQGPKNPPAKPTPKKSILKKVVITKTEVPTPGKTSAPVLEIKLNRIDDPVPNTTASTDKKTTAQPESNPSSTKPEPVKKEAEALIVAPDAKDVKMAIFKDGHPDSQVGSEEFTIIQREILKRIDDTPIESPLPKLHGSEVSNGVFLVICADAATVKWLFDNFNGNKDILNGSVLKVLKPDKLPKHIKVSYKTSDVFTDDSATFLKRLERYNPDLKCRNWTVLKKDVKEKFIIWLFHVTEADLESIKKAKFEAHSGIDRGTFRVEEDPKNQKPPAQPKSQTQSKPPSSSPKNQTATKPSPGGAKNQTTSAAKSSGPNQSFKIPQKPNQNRQPGNQGRQPGKDGRQPGGPPSRQPGNQGKQPGNQSRPPGNQGRPSGPQGRHPGKPNPPRDSSDTSRGMKPHSSSRHSDVSSRREPPRRRDFDSRGRESRWDTPDDRDQDSRRTSSRGSLLPPPRKKPYLLKNVSEEPWQSAPPGTFGFPSNEGPSNFSYGGEQSVVQMQTYSAPEDPFDDYEIPGQESRNRGRPFQNYGKRQEQFREDRYEDAHNAPEDDNAEDGERKPEFWTPKVEKLFQRWTGLLKVARRVKTEEAWNKYKLYRNQYKNAIKNSKKRLEREKEMGSMPVSIPTQSLPQYEKDIRPMSVSYPTQSIVQYEEDTGHAVPYPTQSFSQYEDDTGHAVSYPTRSFSQYEENSMEYVQSGALLPEPGFEPTSKRVLLPAPSVTHIGYEDGESSRPSLLGEYGGRGGYQAPNSRKRNHTQMVNPYVDQQSMMAPVGNVEIWSNNNVNSALLPHPFVDPVQNNGNVMYNNPYGNQPMY